ncbi:Rib/alpha-like domain-containing protein [Lactobacillus hominis]|uniref:Rib domain-containing protein n=1 Tax=Lactobacillus hominis DSM 23910 = CRBIP 24.179 TaxID=1423758 RepID=I7JUM7_9LACO|nr:Rib/alpha-like domain-containing protein [Lactobacillus hominis]KRM85924.1 hypothetical protein FC41_GL000117 [Lactobacillus hominis DSM 23910 = CRBIP 24.179]MCT3348843.1 hypothetical protein [Lactobacillus hominis]CCI81521.1 Putative uncharacterized protein [Lactobacillus hominis DSM 23910 = CRBIP 24.179]
MIKQLNKTIKKLALTLTAAGIISGVGFQSSVVKADTVKEDSKATYNASMDQDLKDHKNLQAYRNPLIAASLTTPVNEVPQAQLGVSNWDSLPAGTTAKWNMEPDVSKAGTSYGQIIVTFPDGSASNLAVYVTASDSSKQAPVEDEQQPANTEKENDQSSVQSPVIVRDANNVKTNARNNNVKENSTVAPQSQSSVVSDETAHVAGDAKLPQTSAKNAVVIMMMGVMTIIASLSLIARNLIKERN